MLKNIKPINLLSGDLILDFTKWGESVNWDYIPYSKDGYSYKAYQLINWFSMDYLRIESRSIRYNILKRYFEEVHNKCINGFLFEEMDESIVNIVKEIN